MIGEGVIRTEGPLKVRGSARYSAERRFSERPLHGFIVGATIGAGRIAAINATAAEGAPGVKIVWTHRNAPAQAPRSAEPDLFSVRPQLMDESVHYYGMPVAFVVADSFEQARAAAGLVRVHFEAAPTASTSPSWRQMRRGMKNSEAVISSRRSAQAPSRSM